MATKRTRKDVIKAKIRGGYIFKFKDIKFRPGVLRGVKYIKKKGFRIFIITNQSGIARGYFTESNVINLHKRMIIYFKKRNVSIDAIKFSPFHPKAIIKKYKKNSNTRKPGNFFIKQIKKKWPLNMKKSFMIGDKISDKICAKRSKIYFEYAKKNFFYQVKNIINK